MGKCDIIIDFRIMIHVSFFLLHRTLYYIFHIIFTLLMALLFKNKLIRTNSFNEACEKRRILFLNEFRQIKSFLEVTSKILYISLVLKWFSRCLLKLMDDKNINFFLLFFLILFSRSNRRKRIFELLPILVVVSILLRII